MAVKKILYFIKDTVASEGEAAEIAAIEAMITPAYSLSIRNAAQNASFADADNIESSDYVAGTPPSDYDAVDVFDPYAPLLVVSGQPITLDHEATKQLQVLAIAMDALTITDVSAEADYESSDEGKATVGATGLITGVAAGDTVITAIYEYDTGQTVSVDVPVIVTAS